MEIPAANRYVRGTNAVSPSLVNRAYDELDRLEVDLLDECVAMVRYAGLCGVDLPGEALSAAALAWQRVRGPRDDKDAERLPALTVAHQKLARALAPASARIAVANCRAASSSSGFRLLGIFPLTRGLALVGLLSLVALVGMHLVLRSASTPIAFGALRGIVSATLAAAAGASFMALIHVGRDSVNRSFDPSLPLPYVAEFCFAFLAGTAASVVALELVRSSLPSTADAALFAFTAAVSIASLIRVLSKAAARLFSRRNAGEQPTPSEGDLDSRIDIVRALIAVQRRLATGAELPAIRRDLARIVQRLPVATALPERQSGQLSLGSGDEPEGRE